MTATITIPNPVTDRTPSHRTRDVGGGRIQIIDVPVFAGHDPEIDGDDERMAEYTPAKIDQIIEMTRTHMARGEFPQVIIRHNEPGGPDREVVGTIERIHARTSDHGAPLVVADIEMSRSDFTRLIASNKYPRRSAEIWPDGHLSEVALLGSETPARPLPDTRFTRDGESDRFSRDEPVADIEEIEIMPDPMTSSPFLQLAQEAEEEHEAVIDEQIEAEAKSAKGSFSKVSRRKRYFSRDREFRAILHHMAKTPRSQSALDLAKSVFGRDVHRATREIPSVAALVNASVLVPDGSFERMADQRSFARYSINLERLVAPDFARFGKLVYAASSYSNRSALDEWAAAHGMRVQ